MTEPEPAASVVQVEGCALRVATWGSGPPDVILLHDGLGSVGQWRRVPSAIATATHRTVLAYDRAGHGSSTPVPGGPWPADWLHREAEILGGLLAAVGADDPILVGHSDGGSIAAIHAATAQSAAPLVLLAAHSWTEDVTVAEIERLRADPEPIVAALARSHDHPAAVFEAWSGAWVSEAFRRWDIRSMIGSIAAPTLVVQGEDDEYATPAHAHLTAEAIGDNASSRLLPGLGHLLHHRAPDTVVDLVADVVQRHSPSS